MAASPSGHHWRTAHKDQGARPSGQSRSSVDDPRTCATRNMRGHPDGRSGWPDARSAGRGRGESRSIDSAELHLRLTPACRADIFGVARVPAKSSVAARIGLSLRAAGTERSAASAHRRRCTSAAARAAIGGARAIETDCFAWNTAVRPPIADKVHAHTTSTGRRRHNRTCCRVRATAIDSSRPASACAPGYSWDPKSDNGAVPHLLHHGCGPYSNRRAQPVAARHRDLRAQLQSQRSLRRRLCPPPALAPMPGRRVHRRRPA